MFFCQVDKMVDQLHSYILNYDLANLREYWNFLNTRLFSRLEQRYMSSIRKLEVGLLKMYLINASQNNKQDKILDFFERMTELLQAQTEFKEWFGMSYLSLMPHFHVTSAYKTKSPIYRLKWWSKGSEHLPVLLI